MLRLQAHIILLPFVPMFPTNHSEMIVLLLGITLVFCLMISYSYCGYTVASFLNLLNY